MIPIIDVFAGPGGLGEGFSSLVGTSGKRQFKIALSVEKDPHAHATLRLRAFRRLFSGRLPAEYSRYLRGELDWDSLAAHHPTEARKAADEAIQLELGARTADRVRQRLRSVISDSAPWILVGGPPCQAYSLVGRSRNKGKENYDPDLDHRQTLYVEYLQILADHSPPLFVMENVKGLLSAQLHSSLLFERIREDLENPASALRREGRSASRARPRYDIYPLVYDDSRPNGNTRFIVRSEQHGIPQRRHRVFLVGVLRGVAREPLGTLVVRKTSVSTQDAIQDLPRVRSGLSKAPDSDALWLNAIRSIPSRPWLKQAPEKVRRQLLQTITRVRAPRWSRGSDFLTIGKAGSAVLNHSSRAHILSDLERYMFAACFASVEGRSPGLADFPSKLLPAHENADQAVLTGHFSDRFRVQVAKMPSTTITSHIAKDGHYYIHYDATQCRSLTVREAACLQTFPTDYFFCGPRTSQYAQVGNAVPPALAAQIARVVAAVL